MTRAEIIQRLSSMYKPEQLNKMSDHELMLFYNIHFREKVYEVKAGADEWC